MNHPGGNEPLSGGLLVPELFVGVTSSVSGSSIRVNLSGAGRASGAHYKGSRYGRGEVNEYVLVEGQSNLLLGRIIDVRLPESDRRYMQPDRLDGRDIEAIGSIQLLGHVSMDNLSVTAGVDSYPRIGDRVYSAPHRFVADLPRLMEDESREKSVGIDLGTVSGTQGGNIQLTPERLFGRHCGILGATGGGKSWTVARIVEECRRFRSKLILIDPTAEYREMAGDDVFHCHLGTPVALATGSVDCSLPPVCFSESDFVALFQPAGKVQGPKLRAAIRSLRLAKLKPALAPHGYIKKIEQPKADVEAAEQEAGVSARLDDPRQEFDPSHLVAQLEQECVWPTGFNDETKWGKEDGNFAHCLSLVARINGALTSPALRCVFEDSGKKAITEVVDEFCAGEKKLLRVCVSGIAFEYSAREVVANAVGRYLLERARGGEFQQKPTVVIVDEAHSFLGRSVGSEDHANRLDAFELIAKEGRKFGLSICLATQRPRDVTESVLSQMGTLVVHRLTNHRDREMVERACGEIDQASMGQLPDLRPGEAAIIGADFPIPLTIKVWEPSPRPISDGPRFQERWAANQGAQ